MRTRESNQRSKNFGLCLLLLLIAPLWAQTRFELESDTDYVLKVPAGYERWPLTADSGGSEWCYLSREEKSDVDRFCLHKKPTYTANTLATVELVAISSVKVVLKDGRTGWVARKLVDMTPEQRKEYQAQQAARARRLAEARAKEAEREAKERAYIATRLAEARAKEAEREAKERAYIATLPKLRSGSSEVLVATSADCARDFKAIFEFGRRNGTGIEYRKKILELISLGCAVNLPSGTAITVSRRDWDFVSFCAYDGAKKGTCGIALTEHVR